MGKESTVQVATRPHQGSAFTLIELLASLAVIGVLAAIVGATYNSSMDNAKTIKCVGNLRTIGAGVHSYAQDRNGFIWTKEEIGFSKYRQSLDPMGLPQLLKDYVPLEAWICPDVRPILRDYRNGYTWSISPKLTGDFIEPNTQPQQNIYFLQNLDDEDLVWDAYNYTSPSLFNRPDDQRGDGSTGPKTTTGPKPHRKKRMANFVALDGHVETR